MGTPSIDGYRLAERKPQCFEDRFVNVVAIFAVVHLHVQVHRGMNREFVQKLQRELRIVDAEFAHRLQRFATVNKVGPPREIDSHSGQNLVHRQRKRTVAENTCLIAECLSQGLAQDNRSVFDRMVAVDANVALEVELQIEHAVLDDMAEHVLEKWYRVNTRHAGVTVEIQLERNFCLGGFSFDGCNAGHGLQKALQTNTRRQSLP